MSAPTPVAPLPCRECGEVPVALLGWLPRSGNPTVSLLHLDEKPCSRGWDRDAVAESLDDLRGQHAALVFEWNAAQEARDE